MTEPELVEIGDDVSVDDASLVAHTNTRGEFRMGDVVVGDGCVLKSNSRILAGAHLESNSILLEHTLVMPGDTVESGYVVQGWPVLQAMPLATHLKAIQEMLSRHSRRRHVKNYDRKSLFMYCGEMIDATGALDCFPCGANVFTKHKAATSQDAYSTYSTADLGPSASFMGKAAYAENATPSATSRLNNKLKEDFNLRRNMGSKESRGSGWGWPFGSSGSHASHTQRTCDGDGDGDAAHIGDNLTAKKRGEYGYQYQNSSGAASTYAATPASQSGYPAHYTATHGHTGYATHYPDTYPRGGVNAYSGGFGYTDSTDYELNSLSGNLLGFYRSGSRTQPCAVDDDDDDHCDDADGDKIEEASPLLR